MLPYGIPFPVVPESTEIMNIIIPEMLQNALTETMTVEEAANDAAEQINALDRDRANAASRRDRRGRGERCAPRPASAIRSEELTAPWPSPKLRRSPSDATPGRCAGARDSVRRGSAGTGRTTSTSLPSLLVMLLVIGYPIVYTVWLSFHATPPRTGERRLQRRRQLPGRSCSDRRLLEGHAEHLLLDDRLDRSSPSSSGSARRWSLHRQFIGRGVVRAHPADPLGHLRRCRRLRLALDLAQRLRADQRHADGVGRHRRAARPARQQSTACMPTLIMVNVWKEFPFVMIMLTRRVADRAGGSCCAPPGSTAPAPGTSSGTSPCPTCAGVILITTLLLFVDQSQLVHARLADDRRRPGQCLAALDHRDLQHRLPLARSTGWPRPSRSSSS